MWVGFLGQAPVGATGICKDGSYTTAADRATACVGHKGVQSWYADAPAIKKPGPAAAADARPQAPGAGPGLVWVNTASNVYHCPGSRFYGKTKDGSYMSEAAAKAQGAHGVRGAACTQAKATAP